MRKKRDSKTAPGGYKPNNLKTRIFLDSGDPQETRAALKLLGFLDGQTTNPTLISKNPETTGKKFSRKEILAFYKKVVQEVSALIPQGSVSIEVYADKDTKAKEMLKQGQEFFSWIPNAHIKFPTTTEGLKAAEVAVREGMRVNMTLCFSQEQAAAVYAAARSTNVRRGQVFVSPFVGRLDDRGENGMDLIANIVKMYAQGDGHVEVLTASVRSAEHILQAIKLGSDILTAPLKVLKEFFPHLSSPTGGEELKEGGLEPIPYEEIVLTKPWQEYDIRHELTDVGVQKFSNDWNALLK